MSTPTQPLPSWFEPIDGPDISHIEIEDDAPVDNMYSEKQQRLLTEPLYSNWQPVGEDGGPRPFVATANVGLFSSPHEPPLVPDVLLSVDVRVHPELPQQKRHQTYFIWEFGKVPDVVIEVVSNKKGGELGKRKSGYERMMVPYFIVWDPEHFLRERELMAYVLAGKRYIPMTSAEVSELGLSLRPWQGVFEDLEGRWLRWFIGDTPIPTGAESTAAQSTRANAAEARAEAARVRAEAAEALAASERTENERLKALLASLGVKAE